MYRRVVLLLQGFVSNYIILHPCSAVWKPTRNVSAFIRFQPKTEFVEIDFPRASMPLRLSPQRFTFRKPSCRIISACAKVAVGDIASRYVCCPFSGGSKRGTPRRNSTRMEMASGRVCTIGQAQSELTIETSSRHAVATMISILRSAVLRS